MRAIVCAVCVLLVPTGCSQTSLLGVELDYSCTSDGVAQTSELAKEINEAIGPGLDSHMEAHGCDSTPNGVYEFAFAAKQPIIDQFMCQTADLVVFEDSADEWLCWAESGRFALYSSYDVGTTAVEVLP